MPRRRAVNTFMSDDPRFILVTIRACTDPTRKGAMRSEDMSDGALVTGGSKGIGHAIAGELARRGHRVVIAGRDIGAAEDAARRIEAATGKPAFAVQADIADRRAAAAAVGAAIERCG